MYFQCTTTSILFLFPALFICGESGAQDDLDEKLRELNVLIQSMKERIDELEDEVERLQQQQQQEMAQPEPEIEERVERIEAEIAEQEEKSASDFRVFWRDSLRFETKDGRFKLRIGGRLQNDYAFFDQDSDLRHIWDPDTRSVINVDTEDGTEFRRARIYLSGDVYDHIEFKTQYDFAGGDAEFKDVYVAINGIPYAGQFKAGHFKEPFSLEELTSSNNITFMERALPNVFSPSRNTGVQLSNQHFSERMRWAIGGFRETDDFGNGSDDGDYNLTARLTGLPLYRNDGRTLIHLGVSYTHKNPDDAIRFRQRPEAHLSPVRFLNTGRFRAENINIYNGEAALVRGPFSMQGEYFVAGIGTTFHGSRTFRGYYGQASYFFTGEHRRYRTSAGAFDSIKPKRNFTFLGEDKGPGAWELALRHSHLDLDDGFVRGGEERNWTVGVNWYLNPVTRFTINYVDADIDHDLFDGDLEILQSRLQLAF